MVKLCIELGSFLNRMLKIQPGFFLLFIVQCQNKEVNRGRTIKHTNPKPQKNRRVLDDFGNSLFRLKIIIAKIKRLTARKSCYTGKIQSWGCTTFCLYLRKIKHISVHLHKQLFEEINLTDYLSVTGEFVGSCKEGYFLYLDQSTKTKNRDQIIQERSLGEGDLLV